MRHVVTIKFDEAQQLEIPVSESTLPSPEAARHWLDAEFTRMDCNPLRASGKVLTADKVLVLASTSGQAGFDDLAWRQMFAAATCSALSRPTVQVDLAAMTVSC